MVDSYGRASTFLYTNDGRTIISAGRQVILWDVQLPHFKKVFPQTGEFGDSILPVLNDVEFDGVDISPDEKLIAALSTPSFVSPYQRALLIWDKNKMALVHRIYAPVFSIHFAAP